jgi:hypothetical protein
MMQQLSFLRSFTATAVLFLVGSLFLAGCSDDPFAPYEPEVANETDNFSLQATGVEGVSMTRDYAWQNTGTTANVNQATTVNKGTATLRILDDQGAQVYSKNLATNGTATTSAGEAGMWTIRIILTDYSGTINFSAEAP